ncbi:M28 family peptidase [Thermonema rossianum]|uniref:M28 family peptidase n=1 Tax=Thermonema rossianum TaxID=55505 RepID=UPI0012FA9799|nr:M28 family peptidase [Thermonema rossianum]
MMKQLLLFGVWLIGALQPLRAQNDSLLIRKIYDEALDSHVAYNYLEYLSNRIGGRLSGSPQAAAAVEYMRAVMDTLPFDTVYLQPVMVPHWVRGDKEEARALSDRRGSIDLRICALGNSVGTGEGGISAPVVEVHSFDELKALGRKKVEGKIVFFNVPMNQHHIETFPAYGEAVRYRVLGASEAAKLGAVAVVVRSVGTALDDEPHTGSLRYEEGVPPIPAVAVSTKGAEQLSALLRQDPSTRLFIETHCRMLPDVLSYNVIGEVWGTQRDTIIAVGGHLDAWDNGDGAHDDGAGCVQSVEAIRLLRKLGVKPRYTWRVVLFMNEENGLRGGMEYARVARERGEHHLLALESDAGGFSPRGFSFDMAPEHFRRIQALLKNTLEPYGLHIFRLGGSGADISPLKGSATILAGLRPDSQRYFDYHHTAIDTFDKINRRELALGAAAMASLVYLANQGLLH